MKNISYLKLFFIVVSISLLFVVACSEEETETITITDAELLDMAKQATGFTWFMNSDALLNKSETSGHNYPFLRTRYNAVAAKQLETSGRIKANAAFEEGSLIVKELYSDANTLSAYAMLYKKANTNATDAKGWVWGYVYANGTVAETSANKGAMCISCHSISGNIDYMLMNKFFQ